MACPSTGTPRGGSQPSTILYQQTAVTICQSGPHSHISIGNSEAVQIGHGNSIVKHVAPAESGESSRDAVEGRGNPPSEEKGRLSDHHGPPSWSPRTGTSFSCLDQTLPDSLSFQY